MSENNYSKEEKSEVQVNYKGQNYQRNPYPNENPDIGTNYSGRPMRYTQGTPMMHGGYRPYPYQPNYQNYAPYPPGYYRGDDEMNYAHNYEEYEEYNHNNHNPYYDDCDCYDYRRPNRRGMRPLRGSIPGYGNQNRYYNRGMRANTWWDSNFITNFIDRPKVNNFLRGVGIATVGMILAPSLAKTVRPIIVKAVQGAMTASEEVKSIFSDAKEDVEDIFAEARWEKNHNANEHREDESKVSEE